jgi:hypothetical protein
VWAFPAPALQQVSRAAPQQPALPEEQLVVQARLAHPPKAAHLRQQLRRLVQDLLWKESLLLGKHHRGRMQLRPRTRAAKQPRVRQAEGNAAPEAGQRRRNLRVAELEKSEARKPGRRKQNPSEEVLSSRKNRRGGPENLHAKQQLLVKEPGKARDLTERRKGPRAHHRHRDLRNNNLSHCVDSPVR